MIKICHTNESTIEEYLFNSNHQVTPQSLAVKPGTSNQYTRHGINPSLRQWKIKESHDRNSKLAQKPRDENSRHVTTTKPITSQLFILLTSVAVAISIKLHCFISHPAPHRYELASLLFVTGKQIQLVYRICPILTDFLFNRGYLIGRSYYSFF